MLTVHNLVTPPKEWCSHWAIGSEETGAREELQSSKRETVMDGRPALVLKHVGRCVVPKAFGFRCFKKATVAQAESIVYSRSWVCRSPQSTSLVSVWGLMLEAWWDISTKASWDGSQVKKNKNNASLCFLSVIRDREILLQKLIWGAQMGWWAHIIRTESLLLLKWYIICIK